jgi:hypothetical protein
MSKFKINEDTKIISYENKMGYTPDFFHIEVTENERSIYGYINEDEAEVLVTALNQFIKKKRKGKF